MREDGERERGREHTRGKRENERGERHWHIALCVKVLLTRTLPTTWKRGEQLILCWLSPHLSRKGSRERKRGDMGREKRQVKPWMRVYFPQKSRPFALLSRSSPSDKLWSLLLCAHGAPQQWLLLPTWRRHGSAGTRACTRACTRGLLYQYYCSAPAEEDDNAPPSIEYALNPQDRL